MNNQEAINELIAFYSYYRGEVAEECQMAITALETIELLHKRGLDVERLKNLDYHKEIVRRINFEDYMELKDEVEELRKKQVPKKPIKDRKQEIRYTSSYSCPSCGGGFTGTGIADYCYHCGQKLDWSVEE